MLNVPTPAFKIIDTGFSADPIKSLEQMSVEAVQNYRSFLAE